MKNRGDIENDFSRRLGWNKVFGLPGQFSFTPDHGSSLIRVFSSDILSTHYGRQVLGLIGFHFLEKDYPFYDRLGISTYILNIPPLDDIFYISDQESMEVWINRISKAILSLPSSPQDLIRDFDRGCIGPFDLKNFEDSTPWHKEFYEWIRYRY